MNALQAVRVGPYLSRVLALVLLGVFMIAPLPAPAAPPVSWTPDQINEMIAPGDSVTVSVSFNASQDLGDLVVRIVPELEPFIAVDPTSIPQVLEGETIEVSLTIEASPDAPLGAFDGTIQLREERQGRGRGRVFARPLPVIVLVHEGIQGADADGNGVWDYIDQYLITTYPGDQNTQAILRQYARAIQGALVDADNLDLALQHASAIDRATECVFSTQPDPDDAYDLLSELEAAVLNTQERSQAYIMFSNQLAGQVFPSAPISQWGASCE